MATTLVLVGADKGGVGKTTVSRALLDYYAAKGVECRPIDAQYPEGVLHGFFPDRAEVVDITKSDGQMKIFDSLSRYPVTMIDLGAGQLTDLLRTLVLLGMMNNKDVRVVIMHLVGSTTASFNEIKTVFDLVKAAENYLVMNHINDATYIGFTPELRALSKGVIEIPRLDDLANETVDGLNMPFNDFVQQGQSWVLRGYVRDWLGKVFAQFEKAGLVP